MLDQNEIELDSALTGVRQRLFKKWRKVDEVDDAVSEASGYVWSRQINPKPGQTEVENFVALIYLRADCILKDGYRRKSKGRGFVAMPPDHILAEICEKPQSVEDRDALYPELMAAFDRLPKRQKEVIELLFWQQMSREEAALVLALSVATVRRDFERARKTLKTRLHAWK